MSQVGPIVDHDRANMTTHCNDARECDRIEWRLGESGDPATLMTSFLASYGLGLPGPSGDPSITVGNHSARSICGAALFLSAAGSAAIVGGPTGAPTPSPAVPDLVVVVYAHRVTGPLGRSLPSEPFRLGEWEPSWTDDDHADAVRSVRDAIAAGDVYQVHVVRPPRASYDCDQLPDLR